MLAIYANLAILLVLQENVLLVQIVQNALNVPHLHYISIQL